MVDESDVEDGPRAIAHAALERYDLDVVRCEPLTSSYNTVFRVDARDGSRYALRISPVRRVHRVGSDEVEASWLDALHRDNVVTVPRFVRTREGAAGVDVSTDDAPAPRRCALMTWVDGRLLRDDPTPSNLREMGRIAGRLHGHEGVAVSPRSVPAFDRVVYWELETRFDELSPAWRAVVDPALERAEGAVEAVWSDPSDAPQLLHGDLNPSNVLRSSGGAAVLDFEDLIQGFPVHDLSISVADLLRYDHGVTLVDAFRAGYEEERTWPSVDDATFGALVASRWLHQIDLGLNLRKPGLDRYVEDLVTRIEARMMR